MIPVLTHIPHKHYTHMRVPTASVIGRENITRRKRGFGVFSTTLQTNMGNKKGTKPGGSWLHPFDRRSPYEWSQYLRWLEAFFNAVKQEVQIILQGISHMIGAVPGLALITTREDCHLRLFVSHGFRRTTTVQYSAQAPCFQLIYSADFKLLFMEIITLCAVTHVHTLLSRLTFLGHADLKAFLQPAVLAAVARDLVNLAVLVPVAGVHHVLLDTATEETLEHQEAKDKGVRGGRRRRRMRSRRRTNCDLQSGQ